MKKYFIGTEIDEITEEKLRNLSLELREVASGDWFLFSKEGEFCFIEQLIDGSLGESGSSVDWYLSQGWKMTPIAVLVSVEPYSDKGD